MASLDAGYEISADKKREIELDAEAKAEAEIPVEARLDDEDEGQVIRIVHIHTHHHYLHHDSNILTPLIQPFPQNPSPYNPYSGGTIPQTFPGTWVNSRLGNLPTD